MQLYLAGLSSAKPFKDEFKNMYGMFTFFSIKNKSGSIKNWIGNLLKEDVFKSIIIDSGAFSFMNSQDEVDFDNYLEKYINFINKYDIEKFMELDIERIKNMETVERYRDEIMQKTGKKPIPVWHPERGIDYWYYMVENFDYVAIGGMAQKTKKKYRHKLEYYFPWFIRVAHENNAKVHGLGYTSLDGLKRFNFDSVDSTRWLYGRFGMVWIFDGLKVKSFRKPERLKDSTEADFQSFKAWKKFQKIAEKRY